MKLGVCSGLKALDKIELMASLGFDYVEINYTEMVRSSDEEIDVFISKLKELNFACEAANCFFPNELNLTGENVDYEAISEYLKIGMERASKIGIKTVIFGSGGARNYPEGFSHEKAYEQLVLFLRDYAGPEAKKYGINIAIEPLGNRFTNIIFTVEDGVMLGRASGCDNVKGLGDLYHMDINDDKIENFLKFPGEVIHTHVCHPSRYYPLPDDNYDYKPFMDALKTIGCERVSIEGRADNFEAELPLSYKVLRAAM